MSTQRYKIPTVRESDTMDFVDAVNGVGTATDAALRKLVDDFKRNPYKLPPASTEPGTLGGVKVGTGFVVYSDGLLELAAAGYKLPPAKADAIGGIVAGRNVNITEDGTISMGAGAISTSMIDSVALAPSAVTSAKIRESAITRDKIAYDVYNDIAGASAVWEKAKTFKMWGFRDTQYQPIMHMLKFGDAIRMFIPYTAMGNPYNESTFCNANYSNKSGKFYASGGAEVGAGEYFTDIFSFAIARYAQDTTNGDYVYKGCCKVSVNGAAGSWVSTYEGSKTGTNDVWVTTPVVISDNIVEAN